MLPSVTCTRTTGVPTSAALKKPSGPVALPTWLVTTWLISATKRFSGVVSAGEATVTVWAAFQLAAVKVR
ncbi:hypothetical protein HPGCJGGD_3742 [Methylobacterium haplocladii]|nr:hypothetical protein HPGCJGGD_3742 [Methylobacterium haplocladii]